MKTNLKIYLLLTSALFSCAPDNKNQVETSKKETPADQAVEPIDNSSGNPSTGLETVNITCSQASGDILSVTLNQNSTWSFSATGPDGQAGSIQSIISTPTFPSTSFTIQGNIVNFKPTTQSELTGSITVTAAAGALTGSKTFTIQSGGTGTTGLGGSGFGGLLAQILPKIMSGGNPLESIQSLGGGTGGGIGNLSSLLGMFGQGN